MTLRRLGALAAVVLLALCLTDRAVADPPHQHGKGRHAGHGHQGHGVHPGHGHTGHAAALPPEGVWLRDVARALADAPAYLEQRARSGGRLAIVLGIDNVALATHYDWPHAVRPTLRVVRRARRLGYAVFFVTGRLPQEVRRLVGPLRRAGFRWEGICARPAGARIAPAKTRCRRAITASGYTVTADIASHPEAYEGGYFERAFPLPSYGGRLG